MRQAGKHGPFYGHLDPEPGSLAHGSAQGQAPTGEASVQVAFNGSKVVWDFRHATGRDDPLATLTCPRASAKSIRPKFTPPKPT